MATRETTSVVGGRSGRLYVWDVRTHGCHGMTYLEAADERPTGRTFHRAPFEPFVLYLANGGD